VLDPVVTPVLVGCYGKCVARKKSTGRDDIVQYGQGKSSINPLTPYLMEHGGSMPYSQGPSNNPNPEPNQPNSSY
jgi:hypothetical protein